jgi:hypothetical protein
MSTNKEILTAYNLGARANRTNGSEYASHYYLNDDMTIAAFNQGYVAEAIKDAHDMADPAGVE